MLACNVLEGTADVAMNEKPDMIAADGRSRGSVSINGISWTLVSMASD